MEASVTWRSALCKESSFCAHQFTLATSLCAWAYYYFHLTNEKTEAQKYLVKCSGFQDEDVGELGLECRSLDTPNHSITLPPRVGEVTSPLKSGVPKPRAMDRFQSMAC